MGLFTKGAIYKDIYSTLIYFVLNKETLPNNVINTQIHLFGNIQNSE